MNPREKGFLLLTSQLGDPRRKPLTAAQLRVLARRAEDMPEPAEDRDLTQKDLTALGYGEEMARRILDLLEGEELLEHYLRRGERLGCRPITRVSAGYPLELRKKLGLDSPGCLWARGDLSILDTPMIALVGSRELEEENRRFAGEVGRQAAIQGFTLISGNARGADRTAQQGCLEAGGRVISILADPLAERNPGENVLYLSEDGFDEPFSAQRALSRNRCIHALGALTFVAQSGHRTGGTWDGTVKNLRFGWSQVCCFDDGSPAMVELEQMGAKPIGMEDLQDFCGLFERSPNFLD